MDGTILYEYEKALNRHRDRAEKRNKLVRRALVGSGIALAFLFGWKALKAEDIMVSAPAGRFAVSEGSAPVSAATDAGDASAIRDSPVSSEIAVLSEPKASDAPNSIPERPAAVPSGPKRIAIQGICKLSEQDFSAEIVDGDHLYACTFDSDEDSAMSALSAIGENRYKQDPGLERKIVSRLIQVIEAEDDFGFLHARALRAVRSKKIHQAIPAIINSFGAMDSMAKEDAVEVLAMFARENDWNSINALLKLLKDENEDIRAQAMGSLLFVDKNVVDAVKLQFRSENPETKMAVCRGMIYLFVESEEAFSREDRANLIRRVSEMRSWTKNKDVLRCLDFFDERSMFIGLDGKP